MNKFHDVFTWHASNNLRICNNVILTHDRLYYEVDQTKTGNNFIFWIIFAAYKVIATYVIYFQKQIVL